MNTSQSRNLVGCAVLVIAGLAVAGDPTPPLQEPAVPAALSSKGVVYHTITGRQAQMTFTSKTPLQNVVGKTNAVVGYAVSGSRSSPAALAGARWLLPVASLATGIPLRDEHLAGDHWLDARTFPLIGFTLTSTEDVELIKRGDGFSTWSATLVGNMQVHGTTRVIRIKNTRLSFLNASPKTRRIADGDLLFLKCSYAISLSDFGIANKDVPGKVSDKIQLNQTLRLSTVPQTARKTEA